MRGIFLALWFLLCNVASAEHNDACKFDHDGESAIGEETKLVCSVQEPGNISLVTWNLHGEKIYEVRKEFGEIKVLQECPTKYSCDGNIDYMIETLTTEVTIKSTSLHEDGTWSCNVTSCEEMRLEFNVTVPPISESITMSGLDDNWVDRDLDYPLSCTVDPIKPDASVFWKIGGQLQLQTTTNHSLNPDGKTFWLEGKLSASFSRFQSPALVECLVTELGQPGNVLKVEEYKQVLIRSAGKEPDVGAIVGGVIAILAVVAGGVTLVVCCCKRRKASQKSKSKSKSFSFSLNVSKSTKKTKGTGASSASDLEEATHDQPQTNDEMDD